MAKEGVEDAREKCLVQKFWGDLGQMGFSE